MLTSEPLTGHGRVASTVDRMSVTVDQMDAKQLRCSVCKHPVYLRGGRGRRHAALIEDGLTLCDVCAPSGNNQPVRFER